ncbi:tetratricopeptide repeat protein [Desulfobacterales bacterium HSG16]|nr:tetratricopeptide repeat protein [Desulfobacterales bacterium HSG16]
MNEANDFSKTFEAEQFRMRVILVSISFLTGTIFAGVKYWAFRHTGSAILLSDTMVSLMLIPASAFAMFSLLMAARDADDVGERELGGGRSEYFIAGIEGPFFIIGALIIFKIGIKQAFQATELTGLSTGLWVLFAGAIAGILLGMSYLWTDMRSSNTIITTHDRHVVTGMYLGSASLVGLFFAYITGWYVIDGFVACIIALHLMAEGGKLLLLPLKGFVDTSEPDFLTATCQLFNEHRKEIWVDIHQLRTWYANGRINVEFHIILPRNFSVEEAYQEPKDLHNMINDQFGRTSNVLIHIEPCIETDCPFCSYQVCELRGRESPKKETLWNVESLTSKGGPSERIRSNKWTAPAKLMSKAIEVADTNTSLLEWLFEIMQQKDINHSAILKKMEDSEIEFRESVLAEELLKQQVPGLRKMLAKMLIFQLAVPLAAISMVCKKVMDLEKYVDQASSLGLLELSRKDSKKVYTVPTIIIPMLQEYLPENHQSLARVAVKTLYRIWWDPEKIPSEDRSTEIHRLAMESMEKKIAVEVAEQLSALWTQQKQPDKAITLCNETLVIAPDDYRLLRNIAIAEKAKGNIAKSLKFYQRGLQNCPDDAQKDKGSILHNMAVIYARQGKNNQALTLFERSLEIKDAIDNIEGKAATLAWLAVIYMGQGNVKGALRLHKQSLQLQKKLGDMKGMASTYHQIAGIHAKEGNYNEAMSLYRQALEIKNALGDDKSRAATISKMAAIYEEQDQPKESLSLYQQLLAIHKKLGDTAAHAQTLAVMSRLSVSIFKQFKTPGSQNPKKRVLKN